MNVSDISPRLINYDVKKKIGSLFLERFPIIAEVVARKFPSIRAVTSYLHNTVNTEHFVHVF